MTIRGHADVAARSSSERWRPAQKPLKGTAAARMTTIVRQTPSLAFADARDERSARASHTARAVARATTLAETQKRE